METTRSQTTHAQPTTTASALKRTWAGAVIVAVLYLICASCQLAIAAPADEAALAPRPSKEQTRQQLAEILAQDKYREADAPQLSPWNPVAAILQAINKALGKLFAARDKLYAAHPLAYWSVVALLAAMLVLIALHMYSVTARAFGGGRSRRSDVTTQLPTQRSSSELRALAERAAENGDFGQAVVYLYLAILVHLDEQGRVVFSTADTNRQLLDQLRDQGTLAADLRPLTNTVDAISYSSRPATADDFAHAQHVSDAVMDSLAATTPTESTP